MLNTEFLKRLGATKYIVSVCVYLCRMQSYMCIDFHIRGKKRHVLQLLTAESRVVFAHSMSSVRDFSSSPFMSSSPPGLLTEENVLSVHNA